MSSGNSGVDPELFRKIRASTAPGMDSEIIEKVLRGYFSGKRDAIRTYKFLNIEMQGGHGNFHGMAIDISRSGMLVRIMDPRFAGADEMEHLMPYTARVWYHFEGGFFASFSDTGVTARGEVVRVTGYCGRGNSLILIGCRFTTPLAEDDCERLSIEHAEDRPPGT